MERERWRRVEELYHSALRVNAEGRARFLKDACSDDPDLREEVESLLAYESSAAQFIEKRANAFAAAFLMPAQGVSEFLRAIGKGEPSRRALSVFDAATGSRADVSRIAAETTATGEGSDVARFAIEGIFLGGRGGPFVRSRTHRPDVFQPKRHFKATCNRSPAGGCLSPSYNACGLNWAT